MKHTIAAARTTLLGDDIVCGLVARHGEPWRSYHVWKHPLAMMTRMEEAETGGVVVVDPDACIAFAGWHDSIYDPEASHGRNEELSARLCEAEAGQVFRRKSVQRACAATRATVAHRPVPLVECPDIELCLDVDLSILGADEATFDEYDVRLIRAEYAHVPEGAYRTGRAAVLSTFLERERLFLTDWGRDRWETAARENLDRAIRRLRER